MLRWIAVFALIAFAPFARAERAGDLDALVLALDIAGLVDVMQDEGLDYAGDIASQMLSGGDEMWDASVARVYNPDTMVKTVRQALDEKLSDAEISLSLGFFQTALGQRIVGLENSARRALMDAGIEASARADFTDLDGSGDARLALIEDFIAANDLVEANVAGGLGSNYMFYRGMVDGGGMEMSDADILADVWSQEADMRRDTREWVFAFSLMAYQPLSRAEMQAYIELSTSPQGRVLNQALFYGFDKMYSDIAYGLGRAAAQSMGGQDL